MNENYLPASWFRLAKNKEKIQSKLRNNATNTLLYQQYLFYILSIIDVFNKLIDDKEACEIY